MVFILKITLLFSKAENETETKKKIVNLQPNFIENVR